MLAATSAAALLAATGPSWGQGWPSQPVRLVMPYPPGGANDIVARIYGKALQQALGQPVVIDNRAGAGGEIANTRHMRDAVAAFDVDIGFIEGGGTHPELSVRRWLDDELVVVSAPGHRAGLRRTLPGHAVGRVSAEGSRVPAKHPNKWDSKNTICLNRRAR